MPDEILPHKIETVIPSFPGRLEYVMMTYLKIVSEAKLGRETNERL